MFNIEYRANFLLCSFFLLLFLMTAFASSGNGRSVSVLGKEHRTSGALANNKELWCYHCNTMDGGERCERLTDNRTDYHLQCKEEKMCMVKSISLTSNIAGNSTSSQKLWLLERNCSKHCEPGCIVIGERTKLYACTKCCEANYCNSGKSSASHNKLPPTYYHRNPITKCVQHFMLAAIAATIFTII